MTINVSFENAINGYAAFNGRLRYSFATIAQAQAFGQLLANLVQTPVQMLDTSQSAVAGEVRTTFQPGAQLAVGTWTASAVYTTTSYVQPTAPNGFYYRASTGGTASGAQPTWPTTVGATVTDGGVTWTCWGSTGLVVAALGLGPAAG